MAARITMKVHAAIARALIDNGVDTMFGLIGDGNLYMVDSYVREFRGRYVSFANEAGAALAALGYALVSGKPGVATVTHGPGLTNTLTALVEGVKGQIPMVLVCGDTAVEERENFQNFPQRDLVVATGAGFEQLRSPRTVAQDVATALRRAVIERRPVALNMPADYQWLDCDYEPIPARVPHSRAFVPSSPDLDDAIGIIAGAKRPIIVAGRGATHPEARAALLRLAARIEAPLGTTLKAKSLFRGEAYNLGIFGTLAHPVATDAILESDCIIAFGASLSNYTAAQGAYLQKRRIVQVNQEAGEIGRIFRPDAGVVGDPALVADTIIHWLDEAEIPPSGFRTPELEQKLRDYVPELDDMGTDRTMDVRRAMQILNGLLPADRVLVVDAGRFSGAPFRYIDVKDPQSFVYTLNAGSIGLGLPHAIGAAQAAPGRPILLVTGDGGFMLGGLVEFNTAVRHNTDLIVAVCNDASYGAEHIQFRDKNMDPGLSIFPWPDLAPIATSLGGTGLTVRQDSDFQAVADAIKDRDRPLLIDIKCDPDRMPRRGGGA